VNKPATPLAILLLLAACSGAGAPDSSANNANAEREVNAQVGGNAAATANASTHVTTNHGPAAQAGIVVPPASELAAAMRGIADPQLAAQVAPDGDYDAAECVVHLGHTAAVSASQQPVLGRAAASWRASLVRELGEGGAAQMIGSSVNMLEPTPPALRMAAIAWCIDHAPESGR